MTRALAAVLTCTVLAGCGSGAVTTTSNMSESTSKVLASDAGTGTVYACEDGHKVRAVFLDSRNLTLHVDAQTVEMEAAPSAKTARYVGGGWQWWTRGLQQATLSPLKPGETIASGTGSACRIAE